eukprot:TRINITY_DN10785_c0_g1_i1.p1 TRINITY_DN10785_c0_g1~~TRINITY_DN10785_c0_g1_i1.p1  ORF type:complete len:323 (+),score=81.62 TRINITY_DN10785_c0_g1_i1:30-971(+)
MSKHYNKVPMTMTDADADDERLHRQHQRSLARCGIFLALVLGAAVVALLCVVSWQLVMLNNNYNQIQTQLRGNPLGRILISEGHFFDSNAQPIASILAQFLTNDFPALAQKLEPLAADAAVTAGNMAASQSLNDYRTRHAFERVGQFFSLVSSIANRVGNEHNRTRVHQMSMIEQHNLGNDNGAEIDVIGSFVDILNDIYPWFETQLNPWSWNKLGLVCENTLQEMNMIHWDGEYRYRQMDGQFDTVHWSMPDQYFQVVWPTIHAGCVGMQSWGYNETIVQKVQHLNDAAGNNKEAKSTKKGAKKGSKTRATN